MLKIKKTVNSKNPLLKLISGKMKSKIPLNKCIYKRKTIVN